MEFSADSFVSKYRDDQFYSSLLVSFNRDLENVLTSLHHQMEENKVQDAIELCHKMAGASATYGYPVLGKLFERLEKDLEKSGTVDGHISLHLKTLDDVCNKITEANKELVVD